MNKPDVERAPIRYHQSMELLEHIELEPNLKARSTVIWLHGLGADGHDFEAIVPELKLPEDSSIRFIFPHAPVRPNPEISQ